jgi:hypothetical protein
MTDGQLALVISAASATVTLTSLFWTIVWSVWQYRRLHRPRLRVLPTNALPAGPAGAGEWCVGITVVNDGGIPVTLSGVKIMVRDDRDRRGLFPLHWVHLQPQPLPLTLGAGERWSGLAERQPLLVALREHFGQRSQYDLWVVATDAADRSFKAKFALAV